MKKLFFLLLMISTGAYAQNNELSLSLVAGGYGTDHLVGALGLEGGWYGRASRHSITATVDAIWLTDNYLSNHHREQYITQVSTGRSGIFTGINYLYRLANTRDVEVFATVNPMHSWPMNITSVYTGVRLMFKYGTNLLGFETVYDPVGKMPLIRFVCTPFTGKGGRKK